MELNHEQCYAAIQSRDERFDGRFFTAVKTTGIYCRPICPANTPRPENVTFYTTAAAAAAAASADQPLTEAQLLKTAEAWRPWRAYAAILLWQKAAHNA